MLYEDGGLDVIAPDVNGQTLLHVASESGFQNERTKDFVWLLLDRGCDPTVQDNNGKTAYDYAVEKGYTEIAELLRQA